MPTDFVWMETSNFSYKFRRLIAVQKKKIIRQITETRILYKNIPIFPEEK
jgi:hypothetical protein